MKNELWANIGCGRNFLPKPWVNYDLVPSNPSVARLDITQPLPWGDGVVCGILIEHCLEHVTGPQAYLFLEEAFRVLMPGRSIRICVPQLKNILTREKRKDLIINHGHQQVFCFLTLQQMLDTAGFTDIHQTERLDIDGHWKEIGYELDDAETLRVEATR